MPNLLLVVGHDSALWDPSVQQPPSSASSPLSIKRNKEKGKKKGYHLHGKLQYIWKAFTPLHLYHVLSCYTLIPKLIQFIFHLKTLHTMT